MEGKGLLMLVFITPEVDELDGEAAGGGTWTGVSTGAGSVCGLGLGTGTGSGPGLELGRGAVAATKPGGGTKAGLGSYPWGMSEECASSRKTRTATSRAGVTTRRGATEPEGFIVMHPLLASWTFGTVPTLRLRMMRSTDDWWDGTSEGRSIRRECL